MRLHLAALTLVFLNCAGDAAPVKEFDGPSAFKYVEQQMAFGFRIPGTEAHERMGDWLDSLLKARADTVVVQAWNHVTRKGDTLRLRNFIARFNPAASTRVLYLAHWDTRPRSDAPTSPDSSKPVPGASDGASGVAVLLGVADALKARPTTIGVDLLFTDGEDYGEFADSVDVLIGSTYYARHPVAASLPVFAVLWDMVGDKDLKVFPEGYSSTGAPEVVDRVWTIAEELGYSGYFDRTTRHTLIDDHVPLQRAGLSAIDVVDFDYPYWHTPDDTIDKVSAASIKIVGDVAVAVLRKVKPQ
ncbi:MAG: M28 family peptidase [Gemmatimonadota bacterium]